MFRLILWSCWCQEPGQRVNGHNFMAKNHKGHWRSRHRLGCTKHLIFCSKVLPNHVRLNLMKKFLVYLFLFKSQRAGTIRTSLNCDFPYGPGSLASIPLNILTWFFRQKLLVYQGTEHQKVKNGSYRETPSCPRYAPARRKIGFPYNTHF